MAQALTTRNEAAPSGFGSLRQSASRVLAEVQLPTRKDEAWRRTDMSSVFAARPVRPPGLAAGASRIRRSGADVVGAADTRSAGRSRTERAGPSVSG